MIADYVAGHPGPLAGILAALDWVAANRTKEVLSAPGDCAFLPRGVISRLKAARVERLAVAASGYQKHPVVRIWSVRLRDELRQALVVEACASSTVGRTLSARQRRTVDRTGGSVL